jgi:hypothetical protein
MRIGKLLSAIAVLVLIFAVATYDHYGQYHHSRKDASDNWTVHVLPT